MIVFFAVVFFLSSGISLKAGTEKRPLTETEIPVSRKEMPNYILEQLKKDPFVKEHFGWKLAFCQHPMYLLIDEDRGEPAVGERIPPWGAPDKERYVERVRRNLQSLEALPELKLNYQWSAVELQDLCKSFPDVYARLKKLYKNGSLDFLDGSYSQAHLQVLGSESNWRQFEYGNGIYKDLFDKNVDTYARQETGLHLQLPQLLRRFGYRFATIPAFIATLEIVDGRFEFLAQEGGFEAVGGDEFMEAVGLDGSEIPIYLQISMGWGQSVEQRELQQDLVSTPKIWFAFPDLAEVGRDTFEEYHLLFDWVLLPDALTQRYKAAPSRAKAKVFSNWSYIEGVWAEELLRANKKAEEAAVLAEEIYCMGKTAGVDVDKSNEIKEVWNTILKSQHHDISWIEVTDLRRKSINRLKEATENCFEMMSEITQKLVGKDDGSIAVFNGLPKDRRCLVEIEGKKSLGPGSEFQDFKGKSLGFVDVPGGGFRSFEVAADSSSSKKTDLPEKIKTIHYIVELSKQGLMNQITTPDGNRLLKTGDYLGGEIRARIDKKWVSNRNAKCEFHSGPVCDVLERKAVLANIPLSERYYFFKEQPFIKAEVEFDFDGNEVGYFWFDKTKINVYYPTSGSKVYHNIPFGYRESRQKRPVFPTDWLYCGGLVYVNRGNIKHWVADGVIANVLGWGGNHFSNRLHWDWLESSQYDLRLYGKQKIEYFLIPVGDFDGHKIVRAVSDITSPVFLTKGKGQKSFYEVKDKDLTITSVYEKDGQVRARGYKLPSDEKSKYRNWEIFNIPIHNAKKD